MNRRNSPFASAAHEIRNHARRIEQAVDDGALDSTTGEHEPVTDEEVRATLATIPDRPRP